MSETKYVVRQKSTGRFVNKNGFVDALQDAEVFAGTTAAYFSVEPGSRKFYERLPVSVGISITGAGDPL